MKTLVLTGTKQEIADQVMRFPGDVAEVILLVNEPAAEKRSIEDFFAEMDAHVVRVGQFDDSREAIYSPDVGA